MFPRWRMTQEGYTRPQVQEGTEPGWKVTGWSQASAAVRLRRRSSIANVLETQLACLGSRQDGVKTRGRSTKMKRPRFRVVSEVAGGAPKEQAWMKPAAVANPRLV